MLKCEKEGIHFSQNRYMAVRRGMLSWIEERQRTRLGFSETDRKLASPTESAGQGRRSWEHSGADRLKEE